MWRLAFAALLAAGCGVELEHGLDERQANQVTAVLEEAGIGADKVADDAQGATGRYKVVVTRAEAARAFSLLEARDLPRRDDKGLAETFAAGGLLPSAVEERARYAAALGAELERTLEALPGVSAARVHLALPAEDPLVGENAHARPTAAVLLRTRGPTAPTAIAESEIRRLVSGAVHTLQPADVSVVVAASPGDAPAPPLERFGPLRVARESRATLATLATSGLALVLLLSGAVLVAALRLSALRRRVRELENR
jgi:type III secretion protein J